MQRLELQAAVPVTVQHRAPDLDRMVKSAQTVAQLRENVRGVAQKRDERARALLVDEQLLIG